MQLCCVDSAHRCKARCSTGGATASNAKTVQICCTKHVSMAVGRECRRCSAVPLMCIGLKKQSIWSCWTAAYYHQDQRLSRPRCSLPLSGRHEAYEASDQTTLSKRLASLAMVGHSQSEPDSVSRCGECVTILGQTTQSDPGVTQWANETVVARLQSIHRCNVHMVAQSCTILCRQLLTPQ